jgi:predicted ArsR family transcriptional regulator
MDVGRTRRGPKPLTARDWIFGSRPRRLVLRFVLHAGQGEGGWTKTDIAEKCGVSKNGGVRGHIEGLTALGLLDEREGRYWPGDPAAALYGRVLQLVDELEHVPEERIEDLLRPRIS